MNEIDNNDSVIADNGVDKSTLRFKQSALLRISKAQQIDFILLSWILLLYRGSGSDELGEFSCACHLSEGNVVKDESSSQPRQVSGRVADVILDGTSSIPQLLKTIEGIRGQKLGANIEDLDRILLTLSNTSGLTDYCENDLSDEIFRIETGLNGDEVSIRVLHRPISLSKYMTRIYIDSFVDILDSCLSDTNQVVAQAAKTTNKELEQIWKWNRAVPPAIDTCLHDIFMDNALGHPDRPAVVSWDGEFSYGEVDQFSSRLAAQLLGHGVQIGEPVMLIFEKCKWTVISVLAVMKAGGALVMTDPAQPEMRLRTIAEEINARLILTSELQAELGAKISHDAKIITVGPSTLDDLTKSPPTNAPLPKVPGSSTLYIIFTSGSTGKPKGVVISHTNYTSGAVPRAKAVGYEAHSRVLDFPSYAFDVSIDCMLCTLANGGCICVPSDEQRVNDLGGAITSMNVNMAHMTPSVARVLDPNILELLEVLGLGGEAVSARDATIFGQKTKVIIAYGPSECTVGCTVNNDVGINRAYTNIGKGLGCATWIVDPVDQTRLVPVGAVGELWIEGPIVGTGYLNNPAGSSLVFIENPPWLLAGSDSVQGRTGRFYKTGDLVKYDPDGSGSIFFVGRGDQQVKLRGQRVELGEIEYHLRCRLPQGVKSAVEVVTPGNLKENATLVAFVETQGEIGERASSFPPELRQTIAEMDTELAKVLPRYMVPAAYIPVTEIPLLVSLKTDRKKLRAIGSGLSRKDIANLKLTRAEKREPQTDIEHMLHGLWKRLLGEEAGIGSNDNFFDVGGDSLKAMKLVAAARSEKLSITVADIFRHPVLSDMALTVRQIDSDTREDIPAFSLLSATWKEDEARTDVAYLCDVERSAVEDIYPCSPLQEGLMALSAKVKEAYIAQRVVELPLSTAMNLKAAFDSAVVECPILRTRIVQVPCRGLMQVVVKENIPWHTKNNLNQYLQEDRETPMGLGSSLARFGLIEDDETGKTHIVLTIHHALYDGWSMPLVVERINKAYHGLKTERPANFKSFIKFLCEMDRTASEQYWREQIHGADSLQFPVLPSAGYQPQAESLLEHYIPLAKKSTSSTSIATALRGAWALVASEYTATDDIIFGETLTGRNAAIEGIDQIEGPMITTVPVRIHVDRKQRASEFLREIHNSSISRIPHEHFGLQNIRKLTLEARETCELRTGLVIHPTSEETYMDDRDANPANGLVPAGDIEAASEALKFNSYSLMLVCSLDAQGVLVMASFDSKTVDIPQMERVLRLFGHTVQRLCQEPKLEIGDALYIAEEDRAELSRLSKIGPNQFNARESAVIGKDFLGAEGTWIVHPSNPEQLVPAGAVGELLIEGPSTGTFQQVDAPMSIRAITKISENNKFYKTGHLAKYRSDGAIIFLKRSNIQQQVKKMERASEASKEVLALTTKEQRLLKIWSRILNMNEEEIDPRDSFFDLGGDSIGAMKLVSESRIEGLQLTVMQVFKHKYLKEIAENLSESSPAKIQKVKSSLPFELLDEEDVKTFVEKRIQPILENQTWKVLDILPARPLQTVAAIGTVQLPRFSARYELFYFDNLVDDVRLFESCQELVARNEILRTVFAEVNQRYYGIILEHIKADIQIYDIDNDIEEFSHRLCHLDVETRMPQGSSFVKFLYVRCIDGRRCLMLRISHTQYDEICLPLLLQQLSAIYEQKPVPETLPFSTYLRHVVKENIPKSVEYWRDLLKGSSLTVLRPEIPLESTKPAAAFKVFDISTRPKDITVATLPTAAWALCLAKRLSLRDVTFGEVVSGRNIDFPRSDIVMGPCWQYIPVRVKFEPEWTVLDLLNFIQRQHIASSRFEGIGLPEIVEQCTDWPRTVNWFDSVVHQDVAHVERLKFLSATSRMDTIYPHPEPLREWKIQAFLKDNELIIEIVTFESWLEPAKALLTEIEKIMLLLLGDPESVLLD